MKLPFFKFEPDEWLTGKISYQTYSTQGAFIQACCIYWKKEGNITIEDLNFRISKKSLEKLFFEKFLRKNGEKIKIDFMDEQLEKILKTRGKLSAAGHLSAQKRREKNEGRLSKVEPTLNPGATQAQPISTDKDIDKDKEEEQEVEIKFSQDQRELCAYVFKNFLKKEYTPDQVGPREYNLYTAASDEIHKLGKEGLSALEALTRVKAYHDYCRKTGQRMAMKFETVINKAFEAEWEELLQEETQTIKPKPNTRVKNRTTGTIINLGSIANGMERFGTEDFNKMYEVI